MTERKNTGFQGRIAKWIFAAASGLALFSPPTCDERLRMSIVDGTEAFIYSTILNPEVIVSILVPEDSESN